MQCLVKPRVPKHSKDLKKATVELATDMVKLNPYFFDHQLTNEFFGTGGRMRSGWAQNSQTFNHRLEQEEVVEDDVGRSDSMRLCHDGRVTPWGPSDSSQEKDNHKDFNGTT